jgi:F-type H+-transporting ATPase subunit b
MKILRVFLIMALFSLVSFGPELIALENQNHAAAENADAAEQHGESTLATIAKWVNFLVLAWLIYYFLTKKMKIPDTFRSEAEEIRRAIESARQAKEEAEKRLKELDEKMAGLTQEVANIKEKAAKDAETERLSILEAAHAEAKRVVELANREVEAEVRLAKKQLLKIVGDIAVQKGKKIVEAEITEDDQNRLIDDYIGSFEKK